MSIETAKLTPTDGFPTETSESQLETEQTISTLFKTIDPSNATLNARTHVQFCAKLIYQGFPKRYTSQDASQPWLLFWNLQACQTLGLAFDATIKKRAVDTILKCQHPEGGFGGGKGQNAHLLSNYAAVCSLAIAGSAPNQNDATGAGVGGWEKIDRKKMYDWFMSLKQPDGSFLVSKNAEVDMRGIYCLLVVATLLDIITPELVRGLRAFVSSCQTYEGGFSSASQPYFSSSPPSLSNILESPRPALGEAHGGYTFCAFASLSLLEPLDPHPNPKRWMGIDTKRLYRWAANMQGIPVEGGGFKGRTNKLVDGCYSWWVGGLFPLLEDVLGISTPAPTTTESGENSEDWADEDGSLYNRHALQEFILVSSQTETGGLRDKPGRPADAYHTLYNLSGLSSAQHHVNRPEDKKAELERAWVTPPSLEQIVKDESNEEMRKKVYIASRAWTEEEGASKYVGPKSNRVNATHPVFDLTMTTTKLFMNYFYGQPS